MCGYDKRLGNKIFIVNKLYRGIYIIVNLCDRLTNNITVYINLKYILYYYIKTCQTFIWAYYF